MSTHVGACVVDLTGAVRARRTAPSAHRDQPPDAGLDAVAELAAEVVAEAGLPIAGPGWRCPAWSAPTGGCSAPRTCRAGSTWRWATRCPTRSAGSPVAPGNEADLAALAELWFGARRRRRLRPRLRRDRRRRRDRAGRGAVPRGRRAGRRARARRRRSGRTGVQLRWPGLPGAGRRAGGAAAGRRRRRPSTQLVARPGRRRPGGPGAGHRAGRRGTPARRARRSCSVGCTHSSATAAGRGDRRAGRPGPGPVARPAVRPRRRWCPARGRGVGGPDRLRHPWRRAGPHPPGPGALRRPSAAPGPARRSAWCRRGHAGQQRRDPDPRRAARVTAATFAGHREAVDPGDRRGVAGQRGDGAGDTGPRGQDRHRRRSVAGALDPDDDAFARREVPERRGPEPRTRVSSSVRTVRGASPPSGVTTIEPSAVDATVPTSRVSSPSPRPPPRPRSRPAPGIPTRRRRATRPARRCR